MVVIQEDIIITEERETAKEEFFSDTILEKGNAMSDLDERILF